MRRSLIFGVWLLATLGSSAFAGSRETAGINLSGVTDYVSEAPFIDVIKRSRVWTQNFDGKPWGEGAPVVVDDQGWPRHLQQNQRATTLITPSGRVYPGKRYDCSWDGRGKLEMAGGAKIAKRRSNSARVSLRNESEWILSIVDTHPNDPLRNLSCIEPQYSDQRGEIFRPEFVDRWAAFGTIRFMDWMHTNNSKETSWDERPRVDDATWSRKGVPVEIIAALANRQNANAWINIPHLADDNYVYEFAKVLKRELKPGLKIYVELSNEVWNYRFEQSTWAHEQGAKVLGEQNGLATRAFHYGRRSGEIFDIFADVFQDDRERLVNVLAGQAVNTHFLKLSLLANKVWRKTHAIAIAPYVSLNVSSQSTPSHATVKSWSTDQVFSHIEKVALPEAVESMKANKKLANEFGLRLIAYEGGQHLVGVGEPVNDAALTEQLIAANRDPRMGDVYRRYLEQWDSVSGDLMVLFASMQVPGKWGSWGLIETEFQPVSKAHKLKATLDWINADSP